MKIKRERQRGDKGRARAMYRDREPEREGGGTEKKGMESREGGR